MQLPRPFRRHPRLLGSCVCLVVAVVVGLLLYWKLPAPIFLEAGPETTVFDAPLNPDGTPDYVAYVAAKRRPAPAMNENAAPEILALLLLPEQVEPAWMKQFGGLPDGPRFIAPEEFAEGHEQREVIERATDLSLARTWTAEEFPLQAAWLDANEAAIERFLEAAERPRFHLTQAPLSPETERVAEFTALAPVPLVELGQAVAADATRRAANDDLAGATRRIRALRRLARSLHQERVDSMTSLVAATLEENALRALGAVAREADAGADDLLALLAEHRALGGLPEADILRSDLSRARTLSFALELIRGLEPAQYDVSGRPGWRRIDVNELLRQVNREADAWDAEETSAAMSQASQQRRRDHQVRIAGLERRPWTRALTRLVSGGAGLVRENTELLAATSTFAFSAEAGLAQVAERRGDALRRIVTLELDAALRRLRVDHDDSRLGALDRMDPFTDKPLRSRVINGRSTWWSVGPDGVDDNGQNDDIQLPVRRDDD